jgi:hypothetical protein
VRVHALAATLDGGVFVAGTAWGQIVVAPGLAFRDRAGPRRDVHRRAEPAVEHAFLLRLDAAGRTLWAKEMGARAITAPRFAPPGGVTALAVDADGTLVIAGTFSLGRRARGAPQAPTLARLSPDGKVIWAVGAPERPPRSIWGRQASDIQSLIVVPASGRGPTDVGDGGDIVVTGCGRSLQLPQSRQSRRPPPMPPPQGREAVPRSGAWLDEGFVARFTGRGVERWTYHFEPGGGRQDLFTCGTGLAADGAGGVFVGGAYAYADDASAAAAGVPPRGSFVARLAKNAHPLWSQNLGIHDYPVQLAPLPDGRVVVSGAFRDGDLDRTGLGVFDATGRQEWFVPNGPDASRAGAWAPFIATHAQRILWAGPLDRKARFGPFAMDGGGGGDASGACLFVAAFDGGGRPTAYRPLPHSGFCTLDALAVGDGGIWVAGQTSPRWGAGAFVHRVSPLF